ncbi:hypothetical protein C4559_02030 [Candidatus Microgenomates bacterium]|nr:MAG: hypothetical protein C4559_02030 [Candidatus Microgenomates bacterium]
MKNNVSKINLNGNSGNAVFYYRNIHGNLIVRKQSENKIQSDRLIKQFEKHNFFLKYKNSFFNIPAVLNKGFNNNLFFYEYEYIEGTNFIACIKNENIRDLKKIIDKFIKIIEDFSKVNKYYEKEYERTTLNNALKNKIIVNSKLLDLDKTITDKFLKLLEKVKITKEKTLSHGDFTFDNIIIDKEKKLWLIDFLGGFYPHCWLDIIKLFQNTEGEWFKIKYKMNINKRKVLLLDEYIKCKIIEFDNVYMENHYFFMAFNFLRILPYMTKISDKKKILKKIELYINLSKI